MPVNRKKKSSGRGKRKLSADEKKVPNTLEVFLKRTSKALKIFPPLTPPSERLLLLLFSDKMIKAKWFLLGLVNTFGLKIVNKLLKELRSYKSWTSGSFGSSSGMQLKKSY